MKTRLDHHRTGLPARSRRPTPGHRSPLARASADSVVFKRILVPVDFTAGSDRALRLAAALALADRARVLPIHVTPPICFTADCGYGPVNRKMPDEDSLRQTRARLQRLVHRFVPAELAEEVTVRNGEPIEQIMIAAKAWKADLTIMFAHGALGGDSTRPTHTVDRLVREVRCPVLVVHAPGPSRKSQSPNRPGTPSALRASLQRQPRGKLRR